MKHSLHPYPRRNVAAMNWDLFQRNQHCLGEWGREGSRYRVLQQHSQAFISIRLGIPLKLRLSQDVLTRIVVLNDCSAVFISLIARY